MTTRASSRPAGGVEGGDRAAFDRFVAPVLPKVRGVVRRMIGHPEDTEDVLQDALVKAWDGFAGFRGDAAFSTWLTAIAVRAAVDHLRKAKRWRTEAQVAYANICAADAAYGDEVMSAFADPDFSYEVREHIAYCFACVGRSLPADEQAALVLADVADMANRDAAKVLGISESVLRHRLSAARQAMRDKYENLCALVSKTGICHQCKGLRDASAQMKRAGDRVPSIEDLAERLAIVRQADFADGRSRRLHDIFWRRTKEIELAGRGSIAPESDCGVD